ncbi:MAG: glycosyltransferase [Bacilli bacterium]
MITMIVTMYGIFLLWTVFNVASMKKVTISACSMASSRVNLFIPLRNEEASCVSLIHCLQQLTYDHWHCFLLDDESTDNTFALLKQTIGCDPRFTLIKGKKLQYGQVGKVAACIQLSAFCENEADYLFFIDADVRLHSNTLQQLITSQTQMNCGLLTGFLRYKTHTFLNRALVPLQHWLVNSLLPIKLANSSFFPNTAAAQGGFMFFSKQAYFAIDGHKSVTNELVEDVALAKQIKRAGYTINISNISSFANCTMYETDRDVWNGFKKNIFKALGEHTAGALFFASCLLIYVLTPFICLVYTRSFIGLIPLLFFYLQRMWIDYSHRTHWSATLLHPIGILSMIVLLFDAMITSRKNGPIEWKGRLYK